jgi:hypothetical protein
MNISPAADAGAIAALIRQIRSDLALDPVRAATI